MTAVHSGKTTAEQAVMGVIKSRKKMQKKRRCVAAPFD